MIKAGNTKRQIAFLSRSTFSKTTSCYSSTPEASGRHDSGRQLKETTRHAVALFQRILQNFHIPLRGHFTVVEQ